MAGPETSPLPPQPERRRHARHKAEGRAHIVMGRDALIFCETRDLSVGGACVRPPDRFVVQIGEQLKLAGDQLGRMRDARVVDITGGYVHFAFDSDETPDAR